MEHHISSELPEAMLIQEYVDYGDTIPRATNVSKEPTLITTYADGQDVQLATEDRSFITTSSEEVEIGEIWVTTPFVLLTKGLGPF